MTLQTEQEKQKPTCAYCGKPVHGREGKMYCNVDCKNNYNSAIRSKLRERENEFFPAAFKQIKTNYRILLKMRVNELEEEKQLTISRAELISMGFDTRFCTSSYLDRFKNIWKCCFNLMWYSRGDHVFLKQDEHEYKSY